jgi:hypothetical protein
MILMFIVKQTMMKFIIIVMMKKIRLLICNDDVCGDIRHQIYDVLVRLTVRKSDLTFRSMERIPKIQFSMARKFMSQPLRRYKVKNIISTKMLNFTLVHLPYTTAAVLLVAVHKRLPMLRQIIRLASYLIRVSSSLSGGREFESPIWI